MFAYLVNSSQVINIIFSEYFLVFTAYYRSATDWAVSNQQRNLMESTFPQRISYTNSIFFVCIALFSAKAQKIYEIIIQIRPNTEKRFMCHPNNNLNNRRWIEKEKKKHFYEKHFMMQGNHLELPLANKDFWVEMIKFYFFAK